MNTAATGRQGASALLFLNLYGFVLMMVPGFAAPYLATELGLSDATVSYLNGLLAFGTLGTFALTRLADRRGRRRVLLASFAAVPPLCALTALTGIPIPVVGGVWIAGLWLYALAQTLVAALQGAIRAVATVAVTEEADDATRARSQAWLGFIGGMGGAIPLFLAPLAAGWPGGWRWCFVVLIPFGLLLPLIRRRLAETAQFARAEERGRTRRARAIDLLSPRHRRRGVGMLASTALRTFAVSGIGTWAYFHALNHLGIEPWRVTVLYAGGGFASIFGFPIGVRLANAWGRRPALVVGQLVATVSGTAYFFVTADLGAWLPFALGACFGGFALGQQLLGVADRCLDTEAFPTELRATYVGVRYIVEASTHVVSNVLIGLFLAPLGGLPATIGLFAVVGLVPGIAILLLTAPETRGMGLLEVALEPGAPTERTG